MCIVTTAYPLHSVLIMQYTVRHVYCTFLFIFSELWPIHSEIEQTVTWVYTGHYTRMSLRPLCTTRIMIILWYRYNYIVEWTVQLAVIILRWNYFIFRLRPTLWIFPKRVPELQWVSQVWRIYLFFHSSITSCSTSLVISTTHILDII